MTFGERIRAERLKRGWSLREAAANISISHTYLSAIEKGKDPRTGRPVTPSPDSLLKICNVYLLPYRELSKTFSSVNESDLLRFLVVQLRYLRQTDPKLYRSVLREAEWDAASDHWDLPLR